MKPASSVPRPFSEHALPSASSPPAGSPARARCESKQSPGGYQSSRTTHGQQHPTGVPVRRLISAGSTAANRTPQQPRATATGGGAMRRTPASNACATNVAGRSADGSSPPPAVWALRNAGMASELPCGNAASGRDGPVGRAGWGAVRAPFARLRRAPRERDDPERQPRRRPCAPPALDQRREVAAVARACND
jgi:hypothetical protein